MAQYIDKSALVAEIEKWLGETDKGFPNDHNLGRYDMCKKMLSFINSLEVKEIDSNDSFIEKAAKWLEDNAVKYWGTDAVDNGMMIYDFKNAMKL